MADIWSINRLTHSQLVEETSKVLNYLIEDIEKPFVGLHHPKVAVLFQDKKLNCVDLSKMIFCAFILSQLFMWDLYCHLGLKEPHRQQWGWCLHFGASKGCYGTTRHESFIPKQAPKSTGSNISPRWWHWSKMIANCVWNNPKIFFPSKTSYFSILHKCCPLAIRLLRMDPPLIFLRRWHYCAEWGSSTFSTFFLIQQISSSALSFFS